MKTILKYRYIFSLFVLMSVALVFISSNSLASTEGALNERPEKNILIIHQFTSEYPAHKSFNEGLIKEFEKSSQYKFSYSYAYLNREGFSDNESYVKATVENLKLNQKYSNFDPDIIVASKGVEDFLSDYGDEIFADVPIVTVANDDDNCPNNLSIKHSVIFASVNFDENICLMEKIQTNLKRIYVVIGNSENEKLSLKQIKTAINSYDGEIKFICLNKLNYDEMLGTLKYKSDDSAILFVRWSEDVDGKFFIPVDVLKNIIKEVKIPVYGTQRQYLGTGIVGGYLYDQTLIGQSVGKMSVRMIDGEKPEYLTISHDQTHEYVFDWRSINRWGIDQNKLPNKSKIEYKEETLRDIYGKYCIIGGIIILFEAILIFTLISNRKKRMKAENELLNLNDSLEVLVNERTEELKIAKDKLEKLNEELDISSRIDTLTGLYNRRHIQERLNEEYQAFLRSGKFFSIMIADIDDFKSINDKYGHDIGDLVLKKISDTIRETIREYDVLARWGGEEFLILFPGLESIDAEKRAEIIRKAVESDIHKYNGENENITITIGRATIMENETVEEVIKRSDNALYEGKRTGKNKVVKG